LYVLVQLVLIIRLSFRYRVTARSVLRWSLPLRYRITVYRSVL